MYTTHNSKRWFFKAQFPDVAVPSCLVSLPQRPSLDVHEEETEDGVWTAHVELSKWRPIRVRLKAPMIDRLHQSLKKLVETRCNELEEWTDDESKRGEVDLTLLDGFGRCREKICLSKAWISEVDIEDIALIISYGSAELIYSE